MATSNNHSHDRKIRVLVVDDAVVVRRVVSSVLASDPELEVVATAANGKIALDRIQALKPDLVTLDFEMPELDGLSTLKRIRMTWPDLPVVMLSRHTERGAVATHEAIAAGANDCVALPDGLRNIVAAMQDIRDHLIPTIKGLMLPGKGLGDASPWRQHEGELPGIGATGGACPRRIDLVAIGVSTGGPEALAAILPELPRDFPTPILIVQHMPPDFTRRLAERLRARSAIGVSEAVDGEVLHAGHAWIAPGDFHMRVYRAHDELRLRLGREAQENFCRPSADVLFRSVATACGENSLAVVLTGLGRDGLMGCERIRMAGGQVVVQDQATSVVWGMPGLVAKAGLADQILPVGRIAGEIVRRVARRREAAPIAQESTH